MRTGEAGTSERCSSIVKYTEQKMLSIPTLPLGKKNTKIFFFASLLIETVYFFVAWISNEHYAYPVLQHKKERLGEKQYTAAFLLIFIIWLDLFLARSLDEHG